MLQINIRQPVQRHTETGANSERKRSGRPKATTEPKDKFLCDTQLTGQQLQAQLNSGGSKQVSALLRCQNKTKRLCWAMKHHHWTTEVWKKVLRTDESKFEIFGSSRRIFVCR
uniref:Transposase Tc1-like domain-containing protein n=1 Tax=Pundamilia nyererei TaxID=303518 RepID=A0A3B4FHN7_9CICH